MGKPSEESPHHVDEQQEAFWQTSAMSGLHYQEEYAASLGRLLVRFNDLEARAGMILELTLVKLGKGHLYDAGNYFIQKVDRLELALCAYPTWPPVDFDRMRLINKARNELAHGHFHQDPNTGEFLTRGIRGKKPKTTAITPEEIHVLSDKVMQAIAEVGQLLPHAWFEEIEENENG